jgi:hypothetical protein
MIKDVFHSIAAAGRKLFTNWGAMLITLAIYAALVGAAYLFFTVREATALQVTLSVILPLAMVALFFLLQAIGLSYVRIGVGAGYLLKRALKDCWKILLVSLPLILLFWLTAFVFGKIDQTWFNASAVAASKVRAWGAVGVSALRIFFLFCLLPLIAIHLWMATVREGAGAAFRGFGQAVARALAPRSLLIYALVCAVSGGAVYFLLFKKVTFKNEWTELWAVGIKTALALLMAFVGWLLTLGSMAELTARRAMREL